MSRLGPFEITGELGRGAMGRVMRGRHVTTGLDVAIKVIAAELGADGKYRAAFEREARAVAALQHRSITALYDYGVTQEATGEWPEGAPWLAMEFAPQGCLADYALELNWVRARSLLVQLMEALAHAHARGVIHRDLKPANVLVVDDEPARVVCKLTDFGIAHPIDFLHPRTTAQIPARSAGTPSYMSPEQVDGAWRDFGPWTDLYALGCMGWELVTGRPPFAGPGLVALAVQHLTEAPGAFRPRIAVPAGLEGWLRVLLAKAPAARYRDAAAAQAALERLGEAMVEAVVPAVVRRQATVVSGLEATMDSARGASASGECETGTLDGYAETAASGGGREGGEGEGVSAEAETATREVVPSLDGASTGGSGEAETAAASFGGVEGSVATVGLAETLASVDSGYEVTAAGEGRGAGRARRRLW